MNQTTAATNFLRRTPVPGNRYFVFFSLAILGCLADLWTKSYMFGKHFVATNLPESNAKIDVWFIENWLAVQTTTNPGALFGIGKGHSHWFAMISIVAAIFIVFWLFFSGGARDLFLTFALGAITGGIFGNMYDRLGLWHDDSALDIYKYSVRDWIHFRWKGGPGIFDPWPNFNIADALLVCGASVLFIHALFNNPASGDPKEEVESDAVQRKPNPTD